MDREHYTETRCAMQDRASGDPGKPSLTCHPKDSEKLLSPPLAHRLTSQREGGPGSTETGQAVSLTLASSAA